MGRADLDLSPDPICDPGPMSEPPCGAVSSSVNWGWTALHWDGRCGRTAALTEQGRVQLWGRVVVTVIIVAVTTLPWQTRGGLGYPPPRPHSVN